MNDTLLAKYLDDRNSLSDEEYRALIQILQESPEMAQKLRGLLMTDDALSRHLSLDRKNFESQMAQRLIDLKDRANMAERVRERISEREETSHSHGRWHPSWFQRWGWSAAIAAMLLISVLFYAYTKFSASGRSMQALQLAASIGPNSEVHLKWTDVFDGEEGFQIERSFDGITFQEVARVAAGAETHADKGIQNTALAYYRVRAFSRSGYSNYSNVASVSVASRPAFTISTRGYAGKGPQALVAGIKITGTESKKILIRTLGYAVAEYGYEGVLANPFIELNRLSDGKLIARNDNWQTYDPMGEQNGYVCGGPEEIKATGLVPAGTNTRLESAILITLPPGLYTAEVQGVGETTGITLIEVQEVR